LIIYFQPDWSIADPICTFLFSILVLFTTMSIIKDCLIILMEGVPIETDMERLEQDITNIPGVIELHDLHVWSLSMGKPALSCHIASSNPQYVLKKATKLCSDRYGIDHSTIQIEIPTEDPRLQINCENILH
jgi:zinc transporter 2